MESCLLLVPWIGAQQIIGEHVRRVSVGVRDRKARTAGTVDVLGPRFGAELVVSVRLHRDELSDSSIRSVSSIEGYGKRSCSAIKLIRVDGQSSMWVRFVPPVKSAVEQVFLESSIDDQVFTGREIRLNLFGSWEYSYHQSNPPLSKFSSNPPLTIRFSPEGRYG